MIFAQVWVFDHSITCNVSCSSKRHLLFDKLVHKECSSLACAVENDSYKIIKKELNGEDQRESEMNKKRSDLMTHSSINPYDDQKFKIVRTGMYQ